MSGFAALVARARQVVVARVESQHPRWDERGRIVGDLAAADTNHFLRGF